MPDGGYADPFPVPEEVRCDTCGYRIPEGKVYFVKQFFYKGRTCVQCECCARQIGKYCVYCIDHK